MKRLPIKMIRRNLENVPQYDFPDGFSPRFFQREDERIWARVETSVGEFNVEEEALAHFRKEFGEEINEFTKRCIFIENKDDEVIGTTSAWKGELHNDQEEWGRIHWVAIKPEYQGKGLAKPLLSYAMNVMRDYHSKVYLTSQTTSYQAINLYLNYGFEPFIENETCKVPWELLEKVLDRKIL